jgi:hypothetical protein
LYLTFDLKRFFWEENTGRSTGGIKINKPAPKAPTLTPPAFKKVRSSRVCFLLDYFLILEPLYKVPQDINPDSAVKSASVNGESSKVDKPPIPQAERTTPDPLKP